MGLLKKLVGADLTNPVEAVGNVLDKITTTDEERAAAEIVKAKLILESDKLQAEVNRVESQHRTLFVSGWRPMIGWLCAAGLAIVFVVNPVLAWALNTAGPEIPLEYLMELVIGMLGLGTLRTVEKLSGRAK